MASQDAHPVSAPFAHREFNGQLLLEELEQLRASHVRQKELEDCAKAVRALPRERVSEASSKLRQIATGRFAAQPALAGLLVRWAARLRAPGDVRKLVLHFRELALVGALLGALRRGVE